MATAGAPRSSCGRRPENASTPSKATAPPSLASSSAPRMRSCSSVRRMLALTIRSVIGMLTVVSSSRSSRATAGVSPASSSTQGMRGSSSVGRGTKQSRCGTCQTANASRLSPDIAHRRVEGGHDGGWLMRVAAVANCETADRFVNSASPRAAPQQSFTCILWPETLQARTRAAGARRRGLAGCGVAAVCSTAGARRPSGEERAAHLLHDPCAGQNRESCDVRLCSIVGNLRRHHHFVQMRSEFLVLGLFNP